MPKFNVYTTELWTRRYSVEADDEAGAIAEALRLSDGGDVARSLAAISDPEYEATFAPDGSEVDGKALAWSFEPVTPLEPSVPRWRIDYAVRDRDDKRDESAHDIEAPSAGHALYRFLEDQGIRADTLGPLYDEGALDNAVELAEHGWTRDKSVIDFGNYMAGPLGTPSLDLWDEGRIIQVQQIAREDTATCASCGGHGRTAIAES